MTLQAQKHIMLKNGAFEFDSFKQCSCCCGHSASEHIDYIELCLCDRFLDEGFKVTIPKKKNQDGKLPCKKEQKEQIELRFEITRM